mgnify:CR=1 FL=1
MKTAANVLNRQQSSAEQPTAAMREAMMNAPVGDDVLGDDQTVIQLQDMLAEMLGKEAALFVPKVVLTASLALSPLPACISVLGGTDLG